MSKLFPRIKFSSLISCFSARSAFTLIELMIVVAISALLTTIGISYSNVSQNQVALSVQETATAQVLARAKSLSVATYATSTGNLHTCGFGVAFDYVANYYSFVAYAPASAQGSSCPSLATAQGGITASDLVRYGNDFWHAPLAQGVNLNATATLPLTLVLFYPPEPAALLSTTNCALGDVGCTYQFAHQSGGVPLVTADGSASATIRIGILGQIEW